MEGGKGEKGGFISLSVNLVQLDTLLGHYPG